MKLTSQDLNDLKGLAITEIKRMPPGGRLNGGGPVLSLEEQRMIAFYLASVTMMNRKGLIVNPEAIEKLVDIEPGTIKAATDE